MKLPSWVFSRKNIFVIGGFVLFVLLLAAIKFLPFMLGFGAWPPPPPTTVTSVVVSEEEWVETLNLVGSIQAEQGATFKAEDVGRVAEIHFTPGTKVEQGSLLLRLDVAVEEAQLKSAQAAVTLAKLTYDRMSQMRSKDTVSQQSFDSSKAELDKAQAQVEALKAEIDRKTVVAPFSGVVGIRQVCIGQFVEQGTELLSLYKMSPLYLNFSFPEDKLSMLNVGQQVQFESDSFPGEVFYAQVNAFNPQVDEVSRNVWAQANIANEDGRLRPGMFARLKVSLNSSKRVIPIPVSSVSYAPYGDSVFVIEALKPDQAQRTVRQQFVKLGASRGDQVAILSGLKQGDEIVSAGAFKLMPGAAVVVDNNLQPSNDPNPKPVER